MLQKEKERKKNEEGGREEPGIGGPSQTPRTPDLGKKDHLQMEEQLPRRWCGQTAGAGTAPSRPDLSFLRRPHPCLPGSKKQQEWFMKPVLSLSSASWLLTVSAVPWTRAESESQMTVQLRDRLLHAWNQKLLLASQNPGSF